MIFLGGAGGKVHSLAALDFSGEVKWGELVLTLLLNPGYLTAWPHSSLMMLSLKDGSHTYLI